MVEKADFFRIIFLTTKYIYLVHTYIRGDENVVK